MNKIEKVRVRLNLKGATIEYDKDSKKKKDAGIIFSIVTENQGTYQLNIVPMDIAEEWLKNIQHACEMLNQGSDIG